MSFRHSSLQREFKRQGGFALLRVSVLRSADLSFHARNFSELRLGILRKQRTSF